MKLRTDWARDDLRADLRLGYVDYLDNERASRPDGAGNLVARYDVTRDTAIDWLGRFWLDTQRPGAPALSSGLPNVYVTNRPLVIAAGTSLGATRNSAGSTSRCAAPSTARSSRTRPIRTAPRSTWRARITMITARSERSAMS